VRLEAENFGDLKGCAVESRNDRKASHRLYVQVAKDQDNARLSTRFDEPFTREMGRYDLEVRYFDEKITHARFALFVNGEQRGASWETSGMGRGWKRN
jgi:hypothetical protein